MKANEIRIGNYIQVPEVGMVYCVSDTAYVEFKGCEFFNKGSLYFSREVYFDGEEVQGIPLSEQWLTMFGLKVNKHKDYSTFTTTYDTVGDEKTFIVYPPKHVFEDNRETDLWGIAVQGMDFDLVGISAIKYVHQLQNLYFALTCEELTIKEHE
jgi:hypothetical protein